MAIGDDVFAEFTTTGATYQPASGVEVMVMCVSACGSGDDLEYYDGTNTFTIANNGNAASGLNNTKFPINNSYYLKFVKTSNNLIIAGVQTK